MANATKICRLCLEVIYNSRFETLDNCRVSMLKIISLDLDLDAKSNLLICSTCLEYLQQSFNFKTACLSNDDYLKTFVHPAVNVKLSLEEIISSEIVSLDVIKCEEEKICRFCLKYRDVALFTKLNNIEEDLFLKDMLEKCLPEVDLNITNDPLICHSCMESLQIQFNFIIASLDSCEKIKSYTSVKCVDSAEMDLSIVLSFTENITKDQSMKIDINLIKFEEESKGINDGIFDIVIKKEEIVMVEEVEYYVKTEEPRSEEEYENEPTRCSQFKETPYAKEETINVRSEMMYTCTKCPHQTNRKDSLELHYLVHEEPTKCVKFKCQKCDFTSKWKSSLTKHRLLHQNLSDIAMFQCAHCPYKSKYKKHLRRHCKVHMNVEKKTYFCEYCFFKSENKSYFKQHNKNKHKKDVVLEKDPFRCWKCNFESPYKTELDKHMKAKHNVARYVCWCGYGTQKLYHFKGHSLTHKSSDEVPMYKCGKCDFQSKYKESCKKHLLIHQSREEPPK